MKIGSEVAKSVENLLLFFQTKIMCIRNEYIVLSRIRSIIYEHDTCHNGMPPTQGILRTIIRIR